MNKIYFNNDVRDRLSQSLPVEIPNSAFLNFKVSVPNLSIIYDNGSEFQIEYSHVDTLTVVSQVEHERLGRFTAACIFSLDNKDVNIGYPQRIRNAFRGSERVEFERGFSKSCDLVRVHFDCLQYVITHPERVFRVGKNGKHVLNKKPPHGDDEALYSRINALRSVIQETHGTGKGRPHTHEYDVRGHYRHYKNGKIIFVKPHTCCKGRGAKNIHEYVL